MKKIYLLAFAVCAFVFTANAQTFNDDIESYPLGTIHTSPWLSWDDTAGTADDISVSDEQALSGSKSILVAEGGVIDGVLDLGNQTGGVWYLDFDMYIPSGKSGYFNIQNSLPAGTQWNFHMSFNEAGTDEGGVTLYDASGANQGPGVVLGAGAYPPDNWFHVALVIDLDNLTMDFSVFGSDVATGVDYTGDQLGGINFYSNEGAGESNRYYIDNARFDNFPLSVNDFSADVFSVYPNPVKNKLNIKSASTVNSVVVYDILGKQVLSAKPDVVSPSIDMSGLSSGAYLVQVTIGKASKTIKVIK